MLLSAVMIEIADLLVGSLVLSACFFFCSIVHSVLSFFF